MLRVGNFRSSVLKSAGVHVRTGQVEPGRAAVVAPMAHQDDVHHVVWRRRLGEPREGLVDLLAGSAAIHASPSLFHVREIDQPIARDADLLRRLSKR